MLSRKELGISKNIGFKELISKYIIKEIPVVKNCLLYFENLIKSTFKTYSKHF